VRSPSSMLTPPARRQRSWRRRGTGRPHGSGSHRSVAATNLKSPFPGWW
jgi:hypothetical protein